MDTPDGRGAAKIGAAAVIVAAVITSITAVVIAESEDANSSLPVPPSADPTPSSPPSSATSPSPTEPDSSTDTTTAPSDSPSSEAQTRTIDSWRWLTDRGFRSFGTCEGSESINGTVYPKTISVCAGGRYSEWEGWSLVASGDCSELTGVVGFVDSSKPSAEAVLTIYGNGSPIDTSTYTYGMTRRVHVDIRGYLKVRVSFTSNEGFDEWQENIAIGDGRVRCTS